MQPLIYLTKLIHQAFTTIGESMRLDPHLFLSVKHSPTTFYPIIAITILGTLSILLGQSVVLFINKVPPIRFIVSICINTLFYIASLFLWVFTTWFMLHIFSQNLIDIPTLTRLVFLGSLPFIFGIFVLIPYLGMLIHRLLYAWSFFIVLIGIQAAFSLNMLEALACVVVGWGCMRTFNQLAGYLFNGLYTLPWRVHQVKDQIASFEQLILTRED